MENIIPKSEQKSGQFAGDLGVGPQNMNPQTQGSLFGPDRFRTDRDVQNWTPIPLPNTDLRPRFDLFSPTPNTGATRAGPDFDDLPPPGISSPFGPSGNNIPFS